jgi:hypothetical protein
MRYLIVFLGLLGVGVYSKDLKAYLMRVPIILERLSYGSTYGSSRAILWR